MQISEIPDFNNAEYEDLIEKLLRGTFIFFGAGVSKLAGFKLWRELSNELVERFWKRKREIRIPKLGFDYSFKENLKKHDNELEIFEYLYSLDRDIFIDKLRVFLMRMEMELLTKYILS
jgi:hypothetical protein